MRVDTVHATKVDVCDEHGMWLDDGKLEKMMLNQQAKGLRKRTQKRVDTERRAKRRRGIREIFDS
jgi:Zn-finger nucleic acid-binding protein